MVRHLLLGNETESAGLCDASVAAATEAAEAREGVTVVTASL